jgi:AraC family transcriptional regulator of adaptative response/methylated-DNA-[protein]-cysteine methyltransferase
MKKCALTTFLCRRVYDSSMPRLGLSAFSKKNPRIGVRVPGAAWRAVVRRDRHFDGKFVYAALTTSIYCRPSCPARTPRRRNTLIFRTARDAERQGYVACLRCHPQSSLAPAERRILAALHYIDSHLDQLITLKTLSHVSGLSPNHFRETFKRFVGLSPKSFCDVRRIVGFKTFVRAGESISSACYGVGFGSSRSLYEKIRLGLGMTPAAYQYGGRGVHIRFVICASNSGPVLIARTCLGVCAVLFGQKERSLVNQLRKEFPKASLEQSPVKRKNAMISGVDEDPLVLKLPMSLREQIVQAKLIDFRN